MSAAKQLAGHPVHPAAALFPLLDKQRLLELAESMYRLADAMVLEWGKRR